MIRLAWRLAWRDLRGGPRGLIIVLLCLGVGIASVAGIGSLRAALQQGIAQNGRTILGGDLALSTGLGPLPPTVAAWFRARGARVSATVDTRSILVAPSGHRLLAAVRAVGPGWPMLGHVRTAPPGQFATLAPAPHHRPGLLLAPTGAATLGLHPGDMVSLGGVNLVYRGTIKSSPDSIGDSQLFGVKAFVALPALTGTPLIQPGGLVSFGLQILLKPGTDEHQLTAAFQRAFPGNPWRLHDAATAATGLTRFVNQAALFMTLLGLASLLVGGIGVANGVEAWLAARARSIATLRCLGASAQLINLIHGLQLLILGVPGIVLGLAVGAGTPALVLPLLRDALPLPRHISLYPAPLALAAGFGLLVGVVFALRPLQRAAAISGGALFRAASLPERAPRTARGITLQLASIIALISLAALSVPRPLLALSFSAGAIATLLILRGIAFLLMRLIRRLPTARDAAIALGLRRLHGPSSTLPLMLLSAGAGLSVLVAVAEIRANLLSEFTHALPARAPSFYFIDIQPHDLPKFEAALKSTGAAHHLALMPSLRARIMAVNGVGVGQFHPPEQSAWPLRSDIGFTYAATPPPGTHITHGKWWGNHYHGPPLVSFDARIARQWGLKRGDTITVNVLGRDFPLRIANLRRIDWQSLKINFLMIGTPDPFAGAPHTMVATVEADPGHKGAVLAAVTNALPGVTGIDVGQILCGLAGLLGEIATAISAVGLVALLAGGLVLISAIAAGREARIAEAVVLKTLGASTAQIRRAWLTEFAVAGGAAGLTAASLGTLAAGLIIRFVFHLDFHIAIGVMLITLGFSIALMTALGFVATARVLRRPAAARLRLETGG
jgi:putative ABC transport system permease protein